MSWITRIFLLWLLAWVLFTPYRSHAQATNAAISDLERPIHACEQQVASWTHEEKVEKFFVIVAFICGVVIASVQGSKKTWAKALAVSLGLVVAILTGVNSRAFTADDRTLGRAAFKGSTVINQLWVLVDTLKDERVSPQDKVIAKGEYLKKLLEFQAIGERLNGTSNISAQSGNRLRPFEILPPVYAYQAPLPAWTKNPSNPPVDKSSFYFVGKAYQSSLTGAKQNSFDDALYRAELTLKRQAPQTSAAAILALVKASAVVQDEQFSYDPDTKTYTSYTLLRLSREIQGNGLRSLPEANNAQFAPTTFQKKGWRPADLTANPRSGIFALDTDGGVSRLAISEQGPRIEKLFRLRSSEFGYALTASEESVFVAASSKLGCSVYKYSLATKALTENLLVVRERCVGITTDGNGLYLSIPSRNEIRYWSDWGAASYHSWSFDQSVSLGYLTFDDIGQRIIVADDSGGRAYEVSVSAGKKLLLASNLGFVQSIATSRLHILAASGKKVLFLARSDNHGEIPPPNLESLTGGHIVGVAVDADGKLWFADYDNKLVKGPLTLD